MRSDGSTVMSAPCACGCGTALPRRVRNTRGRYYVDHKHAGAHKTRTYLEEMCGIHLDLALTYLRYTATQYRDQTDIRKALCPFLLYLTEANISDLREVTPQTINRYLIWADEMEFVNVRHKISVLSTFFDWAAIEGHRTAANPIVHKFHGKRGAKANPRPYTRDELDLLWRCAHERGNPMIRSILAIGQEAGLRLAELCNLRLSDVDLVGRTLHVRLLYLAQHCGPFLSLVTAYLDGPAKAHYRDLKSVRTRLVPFFGYLNHAGILSLTDVTPQTIRSYTSWGSSMYAKATDDLSPLSTFFQWARVEGIYFDEDPVQRSNHRPKHKPRRGGRPYDESQIEEFRNLLAEHGTVKARAIFELALESGMRNGEICRLRLEDICLVRRRIKVKLPNKAMRQRETFFSTRECLRPLEEWLALRSDECSHDYLFHTETASPMTLGTVASMFRRILCRRNRGKDNVEGGPESFSLHRLRHTCASRLARANAETNTLMTAFGWVDQRTLQTYVALDEPSKISAYTVAMEKMLVRRCATELLSDDVFLTCI